MRNIAEGEGSLDGRSTIDDGPSMVLARERSLIAAPFSRINRAPGPRPKELYFRYLSRAVGKPSDTKPKRHNHLRELLAHRGWLIAESRSKRIWPLLYLYKWNYSGSPRARARARQRGRSISLRGFAKLRLCCRGRSVPAGKSQKKLSSVSKLPD